MSRFEYAVAALALFLALAAPAGAQQHPLDSQRSTITVRVFKSGLFRAFADNHTIQAAMTDGSVEVSPNPRVEFVVDARRMRVLDPNLSPKDRDDVQARMLGPQVLDTDRFAQIRFRSTAVQPLERDRWLIRGDLELHGQTHQVNVRVALENGHYKGSVPLRQSEFGIVPISIAGGAVKVKDEVTIEFDIVAADR
jgi:polyisoprenoid-binding protein YceI